ncbi:MAG TPA: ABC transporter ATP-binding protein [Natronosporangium sp.]|nr:ABC transporter ATP-binding protein [Natronosporangium sp.]
MSPDLREPAPAPASYEDGVPVPASREDGVDPGDLLRASGVTFSYPQFTLGPIDLAAEPGVVRCIVGPNGSGKTTLVNLLLGFQQPAAGEVRLMGEAPVADGREMFRHVGFCPDGDDLVPELSAEELWEVCAYLHERFGCSRQDLVATAHRLARALEFDPPARPIAQYSHGMRKKTQLVAALLHGPRVAVFDEPTSGLDPIASYRLGELVRSLAGDGTAFLVTTHDLAWAERFSDQVTVLRSGLVVATGATPDVLRRSADGSLLDNFMEALR